MTAIKANERIGPEIAPMPDDVRRPRWSVMIPTFNCARFLGQTLESVLAQDPGPDEMEIVVVDDVSTKDDPEAVVREVGNGRVRFERNSENLGATRNFNRCISLSSGHLIHILHGDDYVFPGYYERVNAAFLTNPELGLVATRCFVVDEVNNLDELSPRVAGWEKPSQDRSVLTPWNSLRTPGVCISRGTYERVGAYNEHLGHTADWDMWLRVAQACPSLFINQPLCAYRMFEGNDTSRVARLSKNVSEYLQIATYCQESGLDAFLVRNAAAQVALQQYCLFKLRQDFEGMRNNAKSVIKLFTYLARRDQVRAAWQILNYGFLKTTLIASAITQ